MPSAVVRRAAWGRPSSADPSRWIDGVGARPLALELRLLERPRRGVQCDRRPLNLQRAPSGRKHSAEAPVSLFEIDVVAATNGVLQLEVDGEIDLSSAPGLLDSVLCAALASDHRQVVIDLHRVSFIDSSGLAAIIETNRRLRDDGSH